MQRYKTIRQAAQAEFVEKRSRFLSGIRPVSTVEEAEAFFAAVKKEHWDARHNVPAYVLREGGLRRCSDDGEPSGTAGMPVLEVLTRAGLEDCAIVVTRYFGGILLGTGGLVRAYTQAAKLAVEAAGIVTMCECAQLHIRCSYGFYGKLEALLQAWGACPQAVFGEEVAVCCRLPLQRVPAFEKELTQLSSGQVGMEVGDTAFFPVDEVDA